MKPNFSIKSFLPLTLWVASLWALEETPLPGGKVKAWGQEPVGRLNTIREEVVLNGPWHFMPSRGEAQREPKGSWGWIRVPGSWERERVWDSMFVDGILAAGAGPGWDGVKLVNHTRSSAQFAEGFDAAWYERDLLVPESFRGKAVVLQLDRISTDAKIFLDGEEVGEIHWPGGEVDLTEKARPGTTQVLRVRVTAIGDGKDVLQFMDANSVIRNKGRLRNKGILGDVTLMARPSQGHLAGLFVKTSVKDHTLAVDIDHRGLSGALVFTASVKEWPSGREVKRFEAKGQARPGEVVALTWPWADPKLWDFRQPNLYTVTVRAERKGWADEITERFGFREFRISGRDFFLNGTLFRLRPVMFNENQTGGFDECIRAHIEAHLAAGFNIAEIWPSQTSRRGMPNWRPRIAQIADEMGFPLIMAVTDPAPYFDPYRIPDEASKAAWAAVAGYENQRLRNHPATLINISMPNRWGNVDDQNPLRLGSEENLHISGNYRAMVKPGQDLVTFFKTLDPTRPLTAHHGGPVGDFQTCNHYPVMTPLQEREEWLSQWAKSGDQPYSAIEFGTPLGMSLARSRKGFDGQTSEPLVTEFASIYFGEKAYDLETSAYRADVASRFKKELEWGGRDFGDEPVFQKLQVLFSGNTWKSWRAFGLSGGMVPWADGYAYGPVVEPGNFNLPPFTPGRRGAYIRSLDKSIALGNGARPRTEAGEMLKAMNQPTLAFLAGHPERFTEKGFHFAGGEKVLKSAALINDDRASKSWAITWKAEAGGGELARGEAKGELAPGQISFSPITFVAPKVKDRTDGLITLTATIGETTHLDRFALRFYPELNFKNLAPLRVYDPDGTSLTWLRARGISVTPVKDPSGPGPLVIGRLALGRGPLPFDIKTLLGKGARILVLGQDPAALRENTPLRLARHVSRRAFPVMTQKNHPVLSGLDSEDFRDWRGSGTLVAETAEVDLKRLIVGTPEYGWHWGNNGSVSGAMWEKPHRGGYTPLLEGEFDLAYSPLMENRSHGGLLMVCSLDLEGRTEEEPAAALMALRLLQYLEKTPVEEASPVAVAGLPEGSILNGLSSSKTLEVPARGLFVVGPNWQGDEIALRRFVEAGGKALILPRSQNLPLGAQVAPAKYGQTKDLPNWPELKGLSRSDLRLRSDHEFPLLIPGGGLEISEGGALGRMALGRGVAVFVQLDPAALPAQTKTYFRYSQWRLSRLTSQIAANLGARDPMDLAVFETTAGVKAISLAGPWDYQVEGELFPAATTPQNATADPGMNPACLSWRLPEKPDGYWESWNAPGMLPLLDGKDGAVWFRKEVDISPEMATNLLALNLGPLDDHDLTYWNGALVGSVGKENPKAWNTPRRYLLRPGFVKPGKNVIAIRLFDQYGGGGFGGKATDMRIDLAETVQGPSPYTPGFRSDFAFGDDPYRYYRW